MIDDAFVVVIVSAAAAPADPGVTLAGLKMHVAPAGRPLQLSATLFGNAPPCGVSEA